jgi:hypothetical protein
MVGVIRVIMSHSSISAPMGEIQRVLGGCMLANIMLANMRINLINYFYFFLDLHEQEA